MGRRRVAAGGARIAARELRRVGARVSAAVASHRRRGSPLREVPTRCFVPAQGPDRRAATDRISPWSGRGTSIPVWSPETGLAHLRPRHLGPALRPGALGRFAEHDVVLPLVVISELEGKRHHPELGWFARQTLRVLDELRIKHGRLDAPVPIGDDGGHLHVELNHSDLSALPAGFRVDSNDSRILAVALNLAADGRDVTLVTKDMPLRVKAASVGLHGGRVPHAPGGRRHRLYRDGRGRGRPPATIDLLYDGEPLDLIDEADFADVADQPCHTGLVLHSARGSALARDHAGQDGAPGARRPRGVRPARALGRAARGARPAARPGGRHRLARRPRRDRQVGARPVRRARGRPRTAAAQARRRVPSAVRRRRPGSRLPARQREREDGALGAGGVRHARCAGLRATSWTRSSTAACSRCCR